MRALVILAFLGVTACVTAFAVLVSGVHREFPAGRLFRLGLLNGTNTPASSNRFNSIQKQRRNDALSFDMSMILDWAAAIPPRDTGLLPIARPLPFSDERNLSSPQYEAANGAQDAPYIAYMATLQQASSIYGYPAELGGGPSHPQSLTQCILYDRPLPYGSTDLAALRVLKWSRGWWLALLAASTAAASMSRSTLSVS